MFCLKVEIKSARYVIWHLHIPHKLQYVTIILRKHGGVIKKTRYADAYGNSIVGAGDYANKNWSTGRKEGSFLSRRNDNNATLGNIVGPPFVSENHRSWTSFVTRNSRDGRISVFFAEHTLPRHHQYPRFLRRHVSFASISIVRSRMTSNRSMTSRRWRPWLVHRRARSRKREERRGSEEKQVYRICSESSH